jgi:plasmid maintenance system antidote protein VapI
MTIEEFAAKINLERTTIYSIFKRKSIDSDLLTRISIVLGCDLYKEVYCKLEPKTDLKPSPKKPQKQFFLAIPIDSDVINKMSLSADYQKLMKV